MHVCDQDTSPTCSLTDVCQHLRDDQVMYCLLRLTTTFDMSTTVKFIYIHWYDSQLSPAFHVKYRCGKICFWSFSVVAKCFIICIVVALSFCWHCWLGKRKSIWPAKIEWWVAGTLSEVHSPADAITTQLSLALLHSRMVLLFWCWLTQVFKRCCCCWLQWSTSHLWLTLQSGKQVSTFIVHLVYAESFSHWPGPLCCKSAQVRPLILVTSVNAGWHRQCHI